MDDKLIDFEDAVKRTMAALNISEGEARSRLLAAVRSGKISSFNANKEPVNRNNSQVIN